MVTWIGIAFIYIAGCLTGSAKKEQLGGFLSDRVTLIAIALLLGVGLTRW